MNHMGPSVYIYQGDLLCEDCGEKTREELTKAGKAPADPSNEYSYDSDDFPKGPYPDGGGEADSPQHCGAHDGCINAEWFCGESTEDGGHKVGMFLENPLTEDGYNYVRQVCKEARGDDHGCVALEVWAPFYEIDLDDE